MRQINLPFRVPLGFYPTPIERLDRLSRYLAGPEIYVKRDDQTGLAGGGNKTRKLEFLLADARARHCDHLVTIGGPQSNHCRQTAAAAARMGMGCSLVLRGDAMSERLGNLLLNDLFGAEVHWAGHREREAVADELAAAIRSGGGRPYLVPLGGSTPLGALGYVSAMQEALAQIEAQHLEIDSMVVASSSAGTQAGLVLGAALLGWKGRILGISIDAAADALAARVRAIAQAAADLLDRGETAERRSEAAHVFPCVEVNANYLGRGYAVVGDLEREAIRTVARTEGLLLDPVYTGRAMGALIDLIHRCVFVSGQRVLFWHTGGAQALSAFAGELDAGR